jgi:hypothetical protein
VKLRMKIGVTGSFLGIDAGTDLYSVHPGDIVEVPDVHALDLIKSGKAEVKLDGPLGRPWMLSMLEKDFEALRAKVEGKPQKPLPPADPVRHMTREERDRLYADMTW